MNDVLEIEQTVSVDPLGHSLALQKEMQAEFK